MNDLNIVKKNNIQITGKESSQSIEIDKKVIDNGFLKKFPHSTLSIFLYLTTHIKNDNSVTLEPAALSDFLPFKLKTIINGLNELEENKIIEITHNQDEPSITININFEQLCQNEKEKESKSSSNEDTNSPAEKAETNSSEEDLPFEDIIRKNSVSIKELTEALVSFIPFDKKQEEIKENINSWIEDFAPEVLQELLRRVLKWQKNTGHTKDKAFYYMKAIIDDWYEKEIFTYERLQYFDQLYRETREIAQVYGANWYNLNSVQMQTFKKWLTQDFALSLSVAKFAVEKAIKRKKDGEPSLQYIEDNFIKPWKQAEIKNIQQAQKYLASRQSSSKNSKISEKNSGENKTNNSRNKKSQNQSDWDEFAWNLDELIQKAL